MIKLKHLALTALALTTFEASAQRALVQYNFTGGARAQRGGDNQIRSAIRNGHNRTNSTNRNSQTGASVGIAVMRFVNFNDSASGRTLNDAFNALKNGTLSGQRTDERNRRADMGVVVSNASNRSGNGSIRGRAQINGAYSVIGSRWVASTTTPHELGHNYNAIHSQAGPPIRSGGRTVYTTMRSGVSENARVAHYSNPNVRYRGNATTCCGRNNAGRVRGVRGVRANRR